MAGDARSRSGIWFLERDDEHQALRRRPARRGGRPRRRQSRSRACCGWRTRGRPACPSPMVASAPSKAATSPSSCAAIARAASCGDGAGAARRAERAAGRGQRVREPGGGAAASRAAGRGRAGPRRHRARRARHRAPRRDRARRWSRLLEDDDRSGRAGWTPSTLPSRVARARLRPHVPRAGRRSAACRRACSRTTTASAGSPTCCTWASCCRTRPRGTRAGSRRSCSGWRRAPPIPSPQSEEQQLRLESDEHVVKIVTVHKSKGLAVSGRLLSLRVGRPALRDGCPPRARRRLPRSGRRTTARRSRWRPTRRAPLRAPGLSRGAGGEPAALLRRADARHPPLHHRVGGDRRCRHRRRRSGCCTLRTGVSDSRGAPRRACRSATDVALRADLETLRARSGGTIRVEPLPPGRRRARIVEPDGRPSPLAARPLLRPVTWAWRVASFTALVGRPRRRGAGSRRRAVGARPGADGASRALDLHLSRRRARRQLPARHPRAHRLRRRRTARSGARSWRTSCAASASPPTGCRSSTTCSTQRPGDPARRRRARPPGRRAARAPSRRARVHLSAGRFDVAGAARAAARAVTSARAPSREAIEALAFARVSGFMRGFIDLVFEDDGRYWLVDYKSNWLGPSRRRLRAPSGCRP